MLEKDGDVVSNEEMRDNFHVIKKHLPIFKAKFDKILSDTNGDVSVNILDGLIEEALKEVKLNSIEERILKGFYESWMAIFLIVGSDRKALEILFQNIGY